MNEHAIIQSGNRKGQSAKVISKTKTTVLLELENEEKKSYDLRDVRIIIGH